MKLVRFSSKQFQKLCDRNVVRKVRISDRVQRIVEDVRLHGDDALIKYTKKFDRIKLSAKEMRVSESEASGAYQDIKPEFITSLKVIIDNINRYYKKQLKKSWKLNCEDGVVLGEVFKPLDSVGVYVPSGTVPLASTVYMTVLPAKMAGVKRIVLVSPPNKYKSIDPHILVVANLLKVNEIYKVGGAQAIAALAFGTKTIPRVDKIVGPGNQFVTEAKRQVFGFAGIDMLAGPSEVVIIANQYSNPNFVLADLRAQSEHYRGLAVLVTTSKRLARLAKKEVSEGYIILVKNIDQAVEVANKLAPEHLQIMIRRPQRIIKGIESAGAVFIGPYTPTAVGDYFAGPSHVLPTGGTARFFSGLGIQDFMKSFHTVSYSKKALEKAREAVQEISLVEGLNKHLDSIKIRFEGE